MKVSLIIPCFNEAFGIGKTYERLLAWYSESKNLGVEALEIVFVNDGSSDNTPSILKGFEGNGDGVSVVVGGFEFNRGRGAALREGFVLSTGDLVIALDADLSYDESHITRILQAFKENPGADIVVVSAYMKGGSNSGVPWRRLLVSRIANWILARFLHRSLRTVTCVVRGRECCFGRLAEGGHEPGREDAGRVFSRGAIVG